MQSGDPIPIPALFYAFAALAALYFAYNLRRAAAARIGRPDSRPIDWWALIPNAITYGIAQRKVTSFKFGYASVMHMLMAWGFMELFFATSVDFFVERGWFAAWLPVKDTPWFAAANEVGGLMLGMGVAMALWRRLPRNRPALLPNDAFSGRGSLLGDVGILLVLLLLTLGGFLTEAARLAIEQPESAAASFVAFSLVGLLSLEMWHSLQPALWWSHAALALTLIALLPQTKLFHALLAIVNAALTNRAEMGQLRPMHITKMMSDPEADLDSLVLGAGQVQDLTWKQLLDAQTCTECARCTSVCPAHAVGSPLSPMKIMQVIRAQLYDQTMGGKDAAELIGPGAITAEELWACTTCGACAQECPVMIDHIPAIVDMRRFLVLSEGAPPEAAASSLEKTVQHGNPWGFAHETRLDWAANMDPPVPLMAQKQDVDVLYWVGCAGSFDPRNQSVTRAMITIFEAAGVDYAILGKEEKCTGDAARRIGEENVYETLAHDNIATLDRYRFKRIVTACPHCMQTIGRDYAQLGGQYEVIHHSAFIEELLEAGKLTPSETVDGKVTFHDPCYLGRHNDQYDAPRAVIARTAGQDALVEMELSRSESFCCGAGGGNMWYETKSDERVNLARFDQAIETGAETVATACSFCLIMMDDAVKVRGKEGAVAVKDIAELVAEGLAGDG